jgi:hypothetical protein
MMLQLLSAVSFFCCVCVLLLLSAARMLPKHMHTTSSDIGSRANHQRCMYSMANTAFALGTQDPPQLMTVDLPVVAVVAGAHGVLNHRTLATSSGSSSMPGVAMHAMVGLHSSGLGTLPPTLSCCCCCHLKLYEGGC